jgi:protein involved in polysaccharide export with SLBB domain
MQNRSIRAFFLAVCVLFAVAPCAALLDLEEIPNSKLISVTIGGSFFETGTFPASPMERVDQFLTRIYTKGPKAVQDANSYSRRDITLKRANGETLSVDLMRFQLTGDYKFNPYLRNEDVLIIPPYNLTYNFIAIGGAVNADLSFQYVSGDRLSDAILFAQGIDPAFENVTKAKINRLSSDGDKEEEITVNISDNPPLKRGDRIVLLGDELLRKDYKVYVDGEVFRPGYIPITRNSSTLRAVVEKAGGMKPDADLNRAEIIRGANVFHTALFSEDFEKMLMLRMSKISVEDSAAFSVDNKLRFFRANGTVNFNKISDSNSIDGNFIVKTGDFIMIPEMVELVYVFGQVNSPGYVKFQKGEHFDYYLRQAGGLGITAKSDIYLIKGKTRSWVHVDKDAKIDIEASDYIWVPKKPVRYFSYYLQQVGTFTSIVGGVATLILLLFQFSK